MATESGADVTSPRSSPPRGSWEVAPGSDAAPATSAGQRAGPGRPGARRVVAAVLAVGVSIGAAAAAYLAWDSDHYVRTDNANVAGNVVNVAAPVAGRLLAWDAQVGQTVRPGALLGAVRVEGAGPSGSTATYIDVRAPAAGVIVQTAGVPGQLVTPSTPLAVIADVGDLWVVANINEQDVHRLAIGQPVDVSIDALPGVRITGHVEAIAQATQSTFALLPSSQGGQFTKVSQLVPVRIRLAPESAAAGLAVGESAEVAIHVN